MTVEQLVRDQLDRATQDVPDGPDLESVDPAGPAPPMNDGRRGHRRRAVLGVGTIGLRIAVADDAEPVADDALVAGAPDLVPRRAPPRTSCRDRRGPGDGRGRRRASAVLQAPDDVYPSDRHTAGPMPDADFVSAKEWQAAYTPAGGHGFVLMAALAGESLECDGCEQEAVAGGEMYREVSQSVESAGVPVRDVLRARRRLAGRRDESHRPGRGAGAGRPGALNTELEALVQDPGLTFAASARPDRQVADRRVPGQVQDPGSRRRRCPGRSSRGVVLLALLLVHLCLHRGRGPTRVDRGDPDAVLLLLGTQRVGERAQPVLGGGVRRPVRVRLEPGAGVDHDDRARGGAQRGQARPGSAPRARPG